MKRISQFIIVTITVCVLMIPALAVPGFAGSSQAEGELFFTPETVIRFSKKVEKSLAQSGARVAIIARVGRPRKDLPEGIRFTHLAIAAYSKIQTADGRTIPGYAVYNLYQLSDKRNRSRLVQDYPIDFFAGVQVLEAGIIIPTSDVQMRLLKVLTSDTYQKLHNPNYSVIANPYTTDLQNCTEHTLDVLFAAIYQTDDIMKIKENEKAYFKAQRVNLSPFKLSMGSIFAPDVAISDHPEKPVTATFTTIGDFLEKYDLLAKRYVIEEPAKI